MGVQERQPSMREQGRQVPLSREEPSAQVVHSVWLVQVRHIGRLTAQRSQKWERALR